ncbi:hypothetical protein Tco_0920341, partial [Tanacetum coccineum]
SGSMDITLTLSLITPLDVQFNTPSPSLPIFGHPIPWNLLEAHGDSCFGCSKHMTGNLQLLRNFVEKFMGTVHFGNDHFAAITEYGDYANIGIFIGYSESSQGFRIYNRRTKNIMEMIHVKFDELTAMASQCNNSEPEINYTNFQDSSKNSQFVPSKTDLDDLFGPLYEEYYATSSSKMSDNSATNTLDNENTSSSSLIVVEEDEALK